MHRPGPFSLFTLGWSAFQEAPDAVGISHPRIPSLRIQQHDDHLPAVDASLHHHVITRLGSYAKKILVDHPEEVSRFDEKMQQHIGETQQLVAQENQNIQQEQQRGFSRSI